MSSYYKYTKHPDTGKWEKAFWIDDYYGHYHYGVKFPDGTAFDPWVNILYTADLTDYEAKILNEYQKPES